jgi:hypothetical protein
MVLSSGKVETEESAAWNGVVSALQQGPGRIRTGLRCDSGHHLYLTDSQRKRNSSLRKCHVAKDLREG